tara:strand:- start:1421 stop:2530 length:1110 start_codon:yes stop_codon:yes gene_type:complete
MEEKDRHIADKKFNKLKTRYRNGSKYYYLIWHNKGKKIKRKIEARYPDESITEIRKRAIKIYSHYKDIEEGLVEDPKDTKQIKYDVLFSEYIEDCKARDVKETTIKQYQSLYQNYAQKHLGSICVDKLTRKDIKNVFGSISKKTKSQANKFLKFIVASLNFAIDEECYGIENNIARSIKGNPEKKITTSYTEKEKLKVFKKLNELENFEPGKIRSISFIWLLILTGARKSEIANAQRSWIKDNKIVIPFDQYKTGKKTGKDRIIYLSDHAMKIINKIIEVCPNEKTITGIKSPEKTWDRIRKECDCPHLRLHDLRHSFATYCLSAGLGHRQVGNLLGHQSLSSMQRYGEIRQEVSKNNVELANKLILLN